MVTTVGTEGSFTDLVTNLIYLERDAIAAYDTSLKQLSDETARQQVAQFKADHLQHLEVLKEMARESGAEAPVEGDMNQMLTTGKVALAGLAGDGAVLTAMKTNEDDTVTAYERAARHESAQPKSVTFFKRAFADEQRHRAWMESTAGPL